MKPMGVFVLLTAVLASCATTGGYEANLQSWVGDSTDHLVAAWGIPQSQWSTSGAGKILEYDRSSEIVIPGVTTYQPVSTTYTNGNVSAYGTNGSTVNGSYNGTSTTYAQRTSAPTVIPQRCVTRFTANAQGQIVNWTWQGNSCRAFAPKPTFAKTDARPTPVSGNKMVDTGRCTAARNLCEGGSGNCSSLREEFDKVGLTCPGVNAPMPAN